MQDRISKQKLNIFLLVDCSTSMRGERIGQVNAAIKDIKDYLVGLESENSNVDFYITVVTFSTLAFLQHGDKTKLIDDYDPTPIKAGGWSNVHLSYIELEKLLKKESQGGVMPDFGGMAPIIMLLTDGHPTKWPMKEEMDALKKRPWFKVALKYGIAIGLNDQWTMDVLREFVDNNGDVLSILDEKALKTIIKIIVVTASKVKSSSSKAGNNAGNQNTNVVQQVRNALEEVDDWEW